MQSYQDIYHAASELDEHGFSATQEGDYRDGIWTAASKLAYEQHGVIWVAI